MRTNKNTQSLLRKPARRDKKAIRKRVSADAFFAAGFTVTASLSCSARLEKAICVYFLCGCVSVLGVSLSAAARSAAALVYDKLTPNCLLNIPV